PARRRFCSPTRRSPTSPTRCGGRARPCFPRANCRSCPAGTTCTWRTRGRSPPPLATSSPAELRLPPRTADLDPHHQALAIVVAEGVGHFAIVLAEAEHRAVGLLH